MSAVSTGDGVGLNPPQRAHFMQLLERDLSTCGGSGELVGLLVIHLSGVGRINLELGYGMGDAVLEQTVERIRKAVRPDDLLVRIDGVDFALIMPGLKNIGQILLASRKIASVCAQSCQIQDQRLSTRPRVGAALAPVHADTAEALLRCADQALVRAEQTAGGLYVFETSADPMTSGSLVMERDLEAALDNNDLDVHFQPKVDLDGGRVVGVEALSRWQHPERGFVRPDLFIAAAERSGLIEPLTQWNLNAALRSQQVGFPTLSVAVNLSTVSLNQPDVADMIEQAVAIWGIEPAQLVLEVTESAMIADPPRTLATLHRLHAHGLKLSIDDFGTGYSSLAYLSELPVCELKIDRSFVLNMTEHRQSENIVHAVIDLAHNLEMTVVAEGIEDQATLEQLRAMGCDVGQGYFFGKPMPVDELDDWLHDSPWSTGGAAVPAGADDKTVSARR